MKKQKVKMVKCPNCGGSGAQNCGTSVQMERAFYYGYPRTYECECCSGTGRVNEGTDPDWWKISDNALGNGGR